MDTFASFITWT